VFGGVAGLPPGGFEAWGSEDHVNPTPYTRLALTFSRCGVRGCVDPRAGGRRCLPSLRAPRPEGPSRLRGGRPSPPPADAATPPLDTLPEGGRPSPSPSRARPGPPPSAKVLPLPSAFCASRWSPQSKMVPGSSRRPAPRGVSESPPSCAPGNKNTSQLDHTSTSRAPV